MSEEENLMTDAIIKSMQEAIIELINDMVKEIMTIKSWSQGEATLIALQIISKNIKPRTEEYYKYINDCKTLWEV